MKIKSYRIVIVIAFISGCFVSLFAQGDGGGAGIFLRYGIGGRALGMGRAFVSVADDASGVYWNPAGLVGAKWVEITSMYSNLYYDSQFTHFGFLIPRPAKNVKDKVARYLIGPSSALAFGWIGLSATGYEQRTNTGVLLGNFGLNENAFLLSWAREEVGTWGIFRYGMTVKVVNQNFPGLLSSSLMGIGELQRDWSGGVDVGFIFQPIHAPIFRVFSLRYLLPLRLGLTIQNLVQPSWDKLNGGRDPFPRVVRFGLSYKWIVRDWLPGSWVALKRLVGRAQFLLAFDKEFSPGVQTGNYFGIEGFLPLSQKGFALFPRIGFNNRADNTSFGIGISMPFASSAIVRIDYAYSLHSYLPEDNRFFMTLQMGNKMGAKYFQEHAQRKNIKRDEVRKYLLRVLAEYPNGYIKDAVNTLAEIDDTSRAQRYYDLIGGLGRARLLFKEAKALLKNGNVKKARKKASEAAEEYAPIFMEPEHSLNDKELLDYGEALIIANRIREANTVLDEITEPSLRAYYLLGVCKKALGDWDGAIEMFRNAVKRYKEEQNLHSMVCLSLLGLGETLIEKEQYQSALTTLNVLLKNYASRLDPEYPRYPIFKDNYVADDAQFLIGLATMMKADSLMKISPALGVKLMKRGIAFLMETQRFYPKLEYGQFVEVNAENMIELLNNKNWQQLSVVIKRFLEEYYKNHKWPPVKEQ